MSRRGIAPTEEDAGDGRRWHIPPPVLGLTGFTGPEGAVILEEIGEPLGPILWRAFRSVATWSFAFTNEPVADLADRPRSGWVGSLDTSVMPAELREPLAVLSALERADASDETAVGGALQAVARWATAAGHDRTGAEFHQLAATVRPSDAQSALEAARSVRNLPDYARAEIWLQRAIGLARRSEDWETYSVTYLAYGNMMRRRGNMPAARRLFERALRRARRHSLQEIAGAAFHDLFVIEAECGRLEEAERYAGEAVKTYPDQHPLLPLLIHDIAYLWMKRRNFPPAFAVLKALQPVLASQGKPAFLGALALASGGASDSEWFDWACSRLLRMPDSAGVSEALAEAAQGARHLGRIREARDLAEHARSLAQQRGEHRVVFIAEATIEQLDLSTDGDRVPVPAAQPYPAIAGQAIEKIERRLLAERQMARR